MSAISKSGHVYIYICMHIRTYPCKGSQQLLNACMPKSHHIGGPEI